MKKFAIQYLVILVLSYSICVIISKEFEPEFWADKLYFSFITINFFFPISKLLK